MEEAYRISAQDFWHMTATLNFDVHMERIARSILGISAPTMLEEITENIAERRDF